MSATETRILFGWCCSGTNQHEKCIHSYTNERGVTRTCCCKCHATS